MVFHGGAFLEDTSFGDGFLGGIPTWGELANTLVMLYFFFFLTISSWTSRPNHSFTAMEFDAKIM